MVAGSRKAPWRPTTAGWGPGPVREFRMAFRRRPSWRQCFAPTRRGFVEPGGCPCWELVGGVVEDTGDRKERLSALACRDQK